MQSSHYQRDQYTTTEFLQVNIFQNKRCVDMTISQVLFHAVFYSLEVNKKTHQINQESGDEGGSFSLVKIPVKIRCMKSTPFLLIRK